MNGSIKVDDKVTKEDINPFWRTVTQVAKRLHKSRAWVHKLRTKGVFPSATNYGGFYLIHQRDVDNYINRTVLDDCLDQCHDCKEWLATTALYAVQDNLQSCLPCYRQIHLA